MFSSSNEECLVISFLVITVVDSEVIEYLYFYLGMVLSRRSVSADVSQLRIHTDDVTAP